MPSNLAKKYLELINLGTAKRADFDEIFAPNYVEHYGSTELTGPESQYELYTTLHSAFPDAHIEMNFEVSETTSEGDLSAGHWTLTGTHKNEFQGIPATGKKVTVSGMSIWKVVDGKNVEEWEIFDTMSLMQQLGVIPTPESA